MLASEASAEEEDPDLCSMSTKLTEIIWLQAPTLLLGGEARTMAQARPDTPNLNHFDIRLGNFFWVFWKETEP